MKIRFLHLLFIVICSVSNAFGMQKDTTYKLGDFLIDATDTTKIDFIIKKTPDKKRVSKGDTLYDSEKYLILGDDDKTSILGIFKKYKLKHNFSEFPTAVYKGKLAPPDFRTDSKAKLFRTQIKEQCKEKGVNFAGHYTIVKWGCGSDCQTIAIVDRLYGRIFYSSLNNIDLSYGIECRADSRMLVLNSGLLETHKGYVSCSRVVTVENIEWINAKARRLPE